MKRDRIKKILDKLQLPHGLVSLVLILGLASCEEEGPNIQLEPPLTGNLKDTSYYADSDTNRQTKNILIEDFTGVRCNNCPKATEKIKALQKEYGDRVVALGIHCNLNFSRPYPGSKENYRIKKGQSLYEMFDKPAQPAGMIDRYQFSGEDGPILDYQKWKGKAPARLNQQTKANIYLIKKLEKEKNQVTAGVKVFLNENVDHPLNLTLAVTQDSIVDKQATPQGKKSDYVLNHLLRKIVTPYKGTKIFDNPEKRQVIYKEFRFSIEEKWDLNNLNLVAFVHKSQPKLTVLQTQKIPI